jgi:hypothetical protein
MNLSLFLEMGIQQTSSQRLNFALREFVSFFFALFFLFPGVPGGDNLALT